MGIPLMHAAANRNRSKWIACILFVEFISLALVKSAFAQGSDATDRMQQMDINRERAESRIERLHENRTRNKAHDRKKNKKPTRRRNFRALV